MSVSKNKYLIHHKNFKTFIKRTVKHLQSKILILINIKKNLSVHFTCHKLE